MALNLLDLDNETRRFMFDEIQLDKESDNFYLSSFLTAHGKQIWAQLLEQSINYDDVWFEREIQNRRLLEQFYTKRKPNSQALMQARVPVTAAQTLAEGEFNRLYVRGLCARVLAEGGREIEAYRARHSENPRTASIAIIGQRFSAENILNDLRSSQGVDSAFGLPAGPNSGISAKRI
ncbi:hypothetical protein IAE49_13845 [Kosakonia sp. S58]|uniref:hypothetical protein n=1 Tax=Kosakonia TaxID=1330547 RepID=UPI0019069D3E|nr:MULTISPECIES: hypothetical protein [unclassified Kosakonia]MBK0015781.1 hypothetical protein [Kosakonia sp. S42]MBK0080355.1 hypothetical protein [Kosakonia sp. S57]MBK0087321.1 hypothetical protein [Kosakonia sp. S58]